MSPHPPSFSASFGTHLNATWYHSLRQAQDKLRRVFVLEEREERQKWEKLFATDEEA
jgi:hypothetical protein